MVEARTSQKRIVILTRDDFEHRYVVNMLSAAIAIDRIIVDQRPRKINVKRAIGRGLGHFLSKAARTAFLKALRDDDARARALLRLFGNKGEAFDMRDNVATVDGINSDETVAILKQINPDAIIVYGTAVIKDTVLSLARDLCFNMHTGISPYYRGTACTFWPVVNGEFDMLGATIHECTSRVDGGKIFEITHAGYLPGDDLHTIFGRAVIAGAEALVKLMQRYLAGRLEGIPQDLSLGREYRGSDLTLGPEMKARFRLAQMRMTAIHNRRK